MEIYKGLKAVRAKTRKEWRRWLEKNHATEKSAWLILYHKGSHGKSINYDEAIREALCFGWIDSVANKRDEESFYLYFARRKPKSVWSKLNRDRAEQLMQQGLMTPAGQKCIDLAKKNGSWEALDEIENLVIPDDLQKLFNKHKTAFKHFQAFAPSSKRIILGWILSAKKTETRKRRIDETVALAAKNIKAGLSKP